ncbi:MAG: acetyl-CoA carboxylase biotin carboxyl carrier protein [Oscillospiraceae bacterium]|nr:acetyl-CoA carboxylase biotin carboxyl carrier protein [Oscillospiraceae bacterium]
MDIIKTTKELANILESKKLSYIYVKDGELEIELGMPETQIVSAVPAPVVGRDALGTPNIVAGAPEASRPTEVSGNFVKSPIIGTFYAAPAPDKPAFVKVGDKIEKGQVVCIVESMKLMNEINSEFAGTVKEILVKDGEAVEFDKKLIRIE